MLKRTSSGSAATKEGQFFGQHLWGEGGRRVIITEGEIDCMTISQLQDNKWPVVSIKSGANAAVNDIKAALEWLETFQEVVFCFDMDEPGRKAAQGCAALLTPGKAKVAHLPLKDANECLLAGKVKDLTSALWNAKPYRPDGIVGILSKLRYLAVVCGVECIVLDHISIVVSGLDEVAESERKTIDKLMIRLRSLVEETGVTVLAVVHLKRPEKGKSWNEGREPSLTDLRGSGSLEQLSDVVIALERNQQGDNSNLSGIRILKNRPVGITGRAGMAVYVQKTGRLLPSDGGEEEENPFSDESSRSEF